MKFIISYSLSNAVHENEDKKEKNLNLKKLIDKKRMLDVALRNKLTISDKILKEKISLCQNA